VDLVFEFVPGEQHERLLERRLPGREFVEDDPVGCGFAADLLGRQPFDLETSSSTGVIDTFGPASSSASAVTCGERTSTRLFE
jgi:hypothetical protein